MDPASLATGVVGCAFQLYIAAREGYQVLRSAQATSEHASQLRTLAGFEQIRFETWAREVGLVDNPVDLEEQLKSDRMTYVVIVEALGHFANLLTKYQDLEKKYGLKANLTDGGRSWFPPYQSLVPPEGSVEDSFEIHTMKIFWSPGSRSEFNNAMLGLQQRISKMRKLKWAISDKAQFQQLVDTLHHLNDGLMHALPRIRQNQIQRALVGGQPSTTSGLDLLIQNRAINDDYVLAAIFRSKLNKQRQVRTTMASIDQGRNSLPADANKLVIDIKNLSLNGRKEERGICEYTQGDEQSMTFVEHKTLGKDETVFFERFVNLADLLQTSPKPSGYRILDCLGYVRDDLGVVERYALVFKLPPSFAKTKNVSFHTLQDVLRTKADLATTPLSFFLMERYRLASLLANSVVYMHFAGWLHRGLDSRNVICLSTSGEKSIQYPFLCGFSYTRPDNANEVSQYESSTLSNLYRHPDYQLPSPSKKFRRSFEIYGLGIILLEVGLWARISTFRSRNHTSAQMFTEHLRDTVVPQLGFHMGQVYRDAVAKCLDTSLLGCADDEGQHLSSAFSKQVVQPLESCYLT